MPNSTCHAIGFICSSSGCGGGGHTQMTQDLEFRVFPSDSALMHRSVHGLTSASHNTQNEHVVEWRDNDNQGSSFSYFITKEGVEWSNCNDRRDLGLWPT